MTGFLRGHLVAAWCALFLSACSPGDEGASTLPIISFQTTGIAFSSTGPDDSTPPSQTLSGTFSNSAIYMAALTEGATDERINAMWPAYETALKASKTPYQVYFYEGTQHGFHNNSTPRYNEAAANLSWERTLAFWKQHLS